SANRRISIPEAFLSVDGILSLYINVIGGLKVYPKMIEKHLFEELPFMATENILMYCAAKGGDRQLLHEAIRELSVECQANIKNGGQSDLLDRIALDARFGITKSELTSLLSSGGFSGLAGEQTKLYVQKVKKILAKNALSATEVRIKV
ncbi:MAG: adenylosuccinate lyase, partial [Clostridiales bacterium]|nr:adenylosuccinate lyase [Clostridiales bacterium]